MAHIHTHFYIVAVPYMSALPLPLLSYIHTPIVNTKSYVYIYGNLPHALKVQAIYTLNGQELGPHPNASCIIVSIPDPISDIYTCSSTEVASVKDVVQRMYLPLARFTHRPQDII